MKRFFFAALFGIAAFAAQASAPSTPKKVSFLAEQRFSNEFGNRKDVVWEESQNNLLKATFNLDGQEITAFISAGGELVATTISMEKSQLPLRLRLALEKELKGQTIEELFFVDMPEENAYYFTAADNGKRKVYRAESNGSIRHVAKPGSL